MKNAFLRSFLLLVLTIPALQGCLDDDSPPVYNYGEQLAKDGEIIDAYLKENNLTATEHASGIRYIIHEEGSGNVAAKGGVITVHYKGTFLDGTVFDTSFGQQPLEFVLGAGQVIAGWDIGFSLLRKGSKATLYLPSGLAYGPRGERGIGPNEILVFEVELLEIQ